MDRVMSEMDRFIKQLPRPLTPALSREAGEGDHCFHHASPATRERGRGGDGGGDGGEGTRSHPSGGLDGSIAVG
jgi:hypothetical protein